VSTEIRQQERAKAMASQMANRRAPSAAGQPSVVTPQPSAQPSAQHATQRPSQPMLPPERQTPRLAPPDLASRMLPPVPFIVTQTVVFWIAHTGCVNKIGSNFSQQVGVRCFTLPSSETMESTCICSVFLQPSNFISSCLLTMHCYNQRDVEFGSH
jgi:hypothetical protein